MVTPESTLRLYPCLLGQLITIQLVGSTRSLAHIRFRRDAFLGRTAYSQQVPTYLGT